MNDLQLTMLRHNFQLVLKRSGQEKKRMSEKFSEAQDNIDFSSS